MAELKFVLRLKVRKAILFTSTQTVNGVLIP